MASSTPRKVGGLTLRRPERLDDQAQALLLAQNMCVVSTVAKDGSVQALPVWVDTDGEHVLLNTVGGRAWVNNLERTGRITCTVVSSENAFEFLEVRGRVEGSTREGADDHIHKMARKYLGKDKYPWMDPESPRLLFKVIPERITHMLPDPE